MEKKADKKRYLDIDDFRSSKSKAERGWKVLMIGIAVEIVVAVAFALMDEWEITQNAPLNQPVATISSTVVLRFKGDGYMHQRTFNDDWSAGISFFLGTNSDEKQQVFNLSARKTDVEFGNIIGGKIDQSYVITLHQNPPYPGFPVDNGLKMPAKTFDDVGCFVLSVPQISSNAEVLSGSVVVTLNSSLIWNFDIPPQKQRWGFITAKKIKASKNKGETVVLPIQILNPQTQETNFFDGK